MAIITAFIIKKNDLQPAYPAQVKDSSDAAVNLTGAVIYCTMKNAADGTLKINRQTIGINISDAVNGKFEYQWQTGNTDTAGKYYIEFEINPASGGKFTVPADNSAIVIVKESMDTT